MKTILKKATYSLVSASFIFSSSCTNIQDDTRRTQAEGALAGAAGGALLGQLIGGDTKATAWGAGLGALAGGLYGAHVAETKKNYTRVEDMLDDYVLRSQQVNTQARNYNTSLKNQIASLRKKIAAARAAKNRQELARLNREVKSARAQTQANIKAYDQEVANYRSVATQASNSNNSSAVNSQLNKLRSQTTAVNSQRATTVNYDRQLADLEAQTQY